MKKAEMIERVSAWNKSITALQEQKDNIFHTLQDIAEEYDIPRYCSIEMITVELIRKGIPSFKWFSFVEEYYRMDGECNALGDFLVRTDNFNL